MTSQEKPLTRERMTDLKYVTAHFEALQGLALLPGLVVLAGYLFFSTWAGGRYGSAVWLIGGAVVIPVAILLGVLITRWYRRTYGELAPRTRANTGSYVATGAALIVVSAIATTLPDTIVSPLGIVTGLTALALGLRCRPLAPVLVPAGVVLIVAALLPLGELLELEGHPLSHVSILIGVICLVWIVTAMYSHRMLDRALRQAP